MEHFARELLNRREINRKHARIHLWNRDQGKFYINNVCFRLERLETNARGYLISRDEKQLGCPIPNVVYSLPTREYEVACNRLDQLFEGRDHFYIRTSRARNVYHRSNVYTRGYNKYLHYFLDAILLNQGYDIETFDSLNDLRYGDRKTITLK